MRQKLWYANEPSLRARIKKLIRPFGRWFGNRKTREALLNRVVATRNYLTHYDEESTKERAEGGKDLYEVYRKMKALFQLVTLQYIGFDEEAIDRIVENNSALSETLQQAKD